MIDWPPFLSPNAQIDFWNIVTGIVCNAPCAIVGCYLVLRRMSLLGDAITHSVLAGIALAFLFSRSTAVWPMFVGALAVGVLTAFLTQALSTWGDVPEDSSMGVVFTTLFAIGVIVISQKQFQSVHLDVDCVLEGRFDTVTVITAKIGDFEVPQVLKRMLPMLGIVALFVAVFWKELKVVSFDPLLATSMGISAVLVHYLLMSVVAAVTVSSIQAVGAVVVIAMLIVPPATAQLLTDRLGWMIGLSVLAASTSAVFGCLAARWLNTNAAGMMAVAAGLQFAIVVFVAPRYGVIAKAWHNLQLAIRIAAEDVVAMLYRREETAVSADPLVQASRTECLRFAGGGLAARLAISRLLRRDQLQAADGTLALTAAGREMGTAMVRTHRLWEQYLDKHFDLPADHLHEPAERLEHFIGPDLVDRIADDLDRPATDPHGREIPPG